MNDQQFLELLESAPQNPNIYKYLMDMRAKLQQYRRIAVSYSGGSDSDTMLDIIELVKPEDCGEIKYVFFDTGLEWDATLRHITNIEKHYGITIERRKAKKPIPTACKEYGIPFISKDMSRNIATLQRNNFNWADTPEDATAEKYPNCIDTVDWYFDRRGLSKKGKKRPTIAERRRLKEFMTSMPPTFKISARCCDFTKKNIAHEFNAEFCPDMEITGIRQAEGGVRATAYRSCFSQPTDKKRFAKYRPLWFWTDEDKQIYKEWRGLRYSDCYEVWGFKRTGCVGCPCAAASAKQLKLAEQYEPNKVKAARAVFGKAYEYREQYNYFKRYGAQIALF